jgi:UDP-N-acetylmuramyl tripeptide synthase
MAVAADAFFGEPTKALEVAGVTGTNGKTTTSFLLRAILAAAGRKPGLVGTIEWVVGGEQRAAPFTTPEAIDLQRLFREMLDAGDRSAAVEASSHGSALKRLDRVRFDALVYTNLIQDHLDQHGTMEDYFQAKRRLFASAQPPPAAVSVSDEWGRRLALELADVHRAPLLTFGLSDAAEVRPERLELGAHGSRFRAAGIDIETPLQGLFNVENVLGNGGRHPSRRRRGRDRQGCCLRCSGGSGGCRRGTALRGRRRLCAHARFVETVLRAARDLEQVADRRLGRAVTVTAENARRWARSAELADVVIVT